MESFNAACVFCDETFSSSKAMSDHLVLCGNKTDLCPTCRRFIRRAIYAYHFENNCANLDESTGSARSNSNSTGARQTKTSNMIKCEFCREDCYQEDYDRHKEKCVYRRKDFTNFNQNRSFVHQNRNDTDVVYLPCQFCNIPIESSSLANHQETCKTQRKTPEQQIRQVNENFTEQFRCIYCKKQYKNSQEYYIHQNTCLKNRGPMSYAEAAGGRRQPSSTT